jgi:hypothetical protein
MAKQSSPATRHGDALGERRYNSYSFLSSALDRGEWSASRPGRALPSVPIVQEAGWAPEPVWTQRIEEKIFCPLPGIEPRSAGRPVRSQTLYCLSYPGSVIYVHIVTTCILSVFSLVYLNYFHSLSPSMGWPNFTSNLTPLLCPQLHYYLEGKGAGGTTMLLQHGRSLPPLIFELYSTREAHPAG